MPVFRQPNGRHRRSRKKQGTSFAAAAVGMAVVTVGGFNLSRTDALATAGARLAAPDPSPNASPDATTARAKSLQQRAAAAAAARASRQRASNVSSDVARRQAADRARVEQERRELEQKRREEARRAARERELRRWVVPISHYRLSASFGQAGSLWSSGYHTGQDFSAPYGTSVKAAHRGEIVSAAWDGAYGRKIVIRHDDGSETWYCHLSSFVRTSGYVTTGELIGRVGSTGNTTGAHLHFEVVIGGDALNPMTYLRNRGVDI